MRVLVFTTVYPNNTQPNLGSFVEQRILSLSRLCDLRVVAPVPSFPLARSFRLTKYCSNTAIVERRNGVLVQHPRFFTIPGVLKFLDGYFLFLSSINVVRRVQAHFDFDIIDSHFAYPDGFAAALLGKYFKKPVTITLRGTINRLIHYRLRRQALKFALKNAAKVISVSSYLAQLASGLNIENEKFAIIPNGVDTTRFKLLSKTECRRRLGIPMDKKVIVSVGALVERKGQHRVIEVLPQLVNIFPDLLYLVVGGSSVEGDMTSSLRTLVNEHGLDKHVRFIGHIDQDLVCAYLSASDVFVLPTRFEGWPNVFMEAMACGLPIVTTDICGNSEVVDDGNTGYLVPFANSAALTQAMEKALLTNWNRQQISHRVRIRPWSVVAEEVLLQFRDVLSKS